MAGVEDDALEVFLASEAFDGAMYRYRRAALITPEEVLSALETVKHLIRSYVHGNFVEATKENEQP